MFIFLDSSEYTIYILCFVILEGSLLKASYEIIVSFS